MSQLDIVEFASNPDPRCPCLLLLDTSGSMGGERIRELNEGLIVLQNELQQDPLASRRVEVAIVTFGNGGVQIVQDFVTAGQFSAPSLAADGYTPMGGAINTGLDLLRSRKDSYKSAGVQYYRPWVFLITDGDPTDSWQPAAQRVRQEVEGNGMAFFAVGVAGANMQTLGQIAHPSRPPIALQGLKFRELFIWLSQSQKRVSGSKPGDQVSLPPVGWGSV
ncbi:MAG: VWA domain-containing protein [Chloroflexota bacterium]|nr:VWA domain-containing protein [Chloroflexota bacterium]